MITSGFQFSNFPPEFVLPIPDDYSFHLGLTHWANPTDLNVSYRILEKDSDWVKLDNPQLLNLDYLDKGRYTIEVKKISIPGKLPQIIRFNLIIPSPWYLNWWALTAIGLVVYFSGFLLSVYRLKAVTRKKKILKELVKARTVELNNQILEYEKLTDELTEREEELEESNRVKEKLIKVVAHDVRSPLIGIQILTDQMKKQNAVGVLTQNDLNDQLKLIYQSTRNLLNYCNDFLRWYNLKGGTVKPLIRKIEITALIRQINELYAVALEGNGNKLVCRYPESAFLFSDNTILEIIIRNLVDNANKYNSGNIINLDVRISGEFCYFIISNQSDAINSRMIDLMNQQGKELEDSVIMNGGEKLNGLKIVFFLVKYLNGNLKLSHKDKMVYATLIVPVDNRN